MSDAYDTWLAGHTQLAWVLAAAVRPPDRAPSTRSYSAEYPPTACEEAWACMAEAQKLMGKFNLPPGRFGWTFQSARFHFATRADGACLGLLTTLGAPADEVENIFADFQAFTPATA